MAVLALVLALTLAGVLPRKGAEFDGRTTQGRGVSFAIARRAKHVVGLRVLVLARCPRFSKLELRRFGPMPIAGDGSFGGVSRDVPRGLLPPGDVARLSARSVSRRAAAAQPGLP